MQLGFQAFPERKPNSIQQVFRCSFHTRILQCLGNLVPIKHLGILSAFIFLTRTFRYFSASTSPRGVLLRPSTICRSLAREICLKSKWNGCSVLLLLIKFNTLVMEASLSIKINFGQGIKQPSRHHQTIRRLNQINLGYTQSQT